MHDHEFPARSAEDGEVWSMSIAESTPDISFTSSQPHDGDDADKLIDAPEAIPPQVSPSQPLPPARDATDNVLSLDPYRDQAASTAPFMTLFGFLVILFAFATPFIRPIRRLGNRQDDSSPRPAVFRNNHLKNGVALQSCALVTRSSGESRFSLSGIAQSQNPVVIRRFALPDNSTIWRKRNRATDDLDRQAISRILRGMTTQDVSDLQRPNL
jgi:hypothetical protein